MGEIPRLTFNYNGGKQMKSRNGDGTGPRGQGPRTGRGNGTCK